MSKYEVTLTGQYEKTITIYADSPKQAKEKMETILFDTDLIDFTDEDFVCGQACITEPDADNQKEKSAKNEPLEDDDCSDCMYYCPLCGECMYEDEM